MACTLHPAPDRAVPSTTVSAATTGEPLPPAIPRPMTRCECADITFQEFARQMAASGASFDEACRRTGCGQICTACLPDLVRHLSSS